MTTFRGFQPEVRGWFEGLAADNSKGYFAARRDFFEEFIRDQMEALLTELSSTLGGEVKMFRQNRDIRFSADKSPYKLNTYGVLRGTEMAAEGLYASISATGLVAASGYHVMDRDQLARYRDGVADAVHGPELAARVEEAEQAGLDVWSGRLATAPRGYPKDHERIDLLRHKNLTLGARLDLGAGISRSDGLEFVAWTWRTASPVTGWLDEHVGAGSAAEGPPRRGR